MFGESMLAPKEMQYFMNFLEKMIAERRQSDKVSSSNFLKNQFDENVVE